MVATGSSLDALQLQLEEFFNPGQPVELLVGIERELSSQELGYLVGHLSASGVRLLGPAQLGTGPWPITLRLRLRRPARARAGETGILPFAVLLIMALGAVGVAGILGWSIGEVFRSLAEKLVPVALIVTGGLVVAAYLKGREGLTAAR